MALMVVLSVFNGFTSVATEMLSRSNPPLIVEAKKGKTINLANLHYEQIAALKQVQTLSPTIEESALLSLGDNQSVVKFRSSDTLVNKCLLGQQLAYFVGLQAAYSERGIRLKLTLPKRDNNATALVPEDNFNQEVVSFGGVFSTRSRLDENYVLIPLNVARQLLDYDSNTFTSLFISPKQVSDLPKLQSKVTEIVGEDYQVKNILEQEPLYYQVVRAEKLGVYIILAFIVFIATFNIVGSLSLLIMDKRKDINILRSMGMELRNIRRIYFYNGLVLSVFGAIIGILIGVVVCFIQSRFGLIKLGGNGFLIDAFPVKLLATDVINVFMLVVVIGIACIGVMVRRIRY
jgi:ABC-type lipoprotein release transport system permease subunit